MNDSSMENADTSDTLLADGGEEPSAEPIFEAAEYETGAITYPPHPVGPGGTERVGSVDLAEFDAHVITWTTSTATPPGVRAPNTLAIVEFDMGAGYDGPPVRALGQVVEADAEDVAIGDAVTPVYTSQLREPGAGIREPDSQSWDGFRFAVID